MADSAQLATLMKGGAAKVDELRRTVDGMRIETAFQECRTALASLSDKEQFEVWHNARRQIDRTSGVLCVAELRMPPQPVFGPYAMPAGDSLTDYDRARTFILKNRTPGTVIPNFYPEFRRLPARDRILRLAEAHVGCAPSGDKQTNLFSLCGKLGLADARTSTTPNGTTCALFLRAVLRAAEDSRMTDDMLPTRANMVFSMGIRDTESDPWVTGLKNPDRNRSPKRGDLYYICIPAVIQGTDKTKQDSGHVGIITDARKPNDRALSFDTIDGGNAGSDGKGFHTIKSSRSFTKNNAGNWEQTGKKLVQGEHRILVGFVDLDKALTAFVPKQSYSMDGRSIDATYPE
jgi:hypothetical protein